MRARAGGWVLMLLAAVLAGTACASGASRGGADSSRITQDELTSVQVSTMYDAIQRLRPRWLQVRSSRSMMQGDTEIAVYQGQTRLGNADILRQMLPTGAVWLEYLDGATASATLPGLHTHVQGAIILHMRPGR
ncbi:MAG TPA: hypothetical protein VK929_16850 [Longimicrobiales bacterium]|nr:hypothetical protein [Longimicrobiales bacterium]